jgi:hypothetical protein
VRVSSTRTLGAASQSARYDRWPMWTTPAMLDSRFAVGRNRRSPYDDSVELIGTQGFLAGLLTWFATSATGKGSAMPSTLPCWPGVPARLLTWTQSEDLAGTLQQAVNAKHKANYYRQHGQSKRGGAVVIGSPLTFKDQRICINPASRRIGYGLRLPGRRPRPALPVAPDLCDWLPDGHLAWFILDAVDQLDLDLFLPGPPRRRPRPSRLRPKLLLGVLLYGYRIGVRSSRRIERRCHEDIAFRVLAANQTPDHVTIARFRVRHEQALASNSDQLRRR